MGRRKIEGDNGDNLLNGGNGEDEIRGRRGADTLNGGGDDDRLRDARPPAPLAVPNRCGAGARPRPASRPGDAAE